MNGRGTVVLASIVGASVLLLVTLAVLAIVVLYRSERRMAIRRGSGSASYQSLSA